MVSAISSHPARMSGDAQSLSSGCMSFGSTRNVDSSSCGAEADDERQQEDCRAEGGYTDPGLF